MDDPNLKERLLDAALPHVPFDGWSPKTYRLAVEEAGIDQGLADTACPRGAVDLGTRLSRPGRPLRCAQRLKTADSSPI